jgi:NAD(P)-dependent dehydrogenase (short-subunit alcohol dehydrogenase family)
MSRTLVACFLALAMSTVPAMNATAQSRAGHDRQVILITGSTDGLGREVALRMGSEGHHVIVHGRNIERGEAVVRAIRGEGSGSAAFYPADLASMAEVRRLAERILADHDRLDVLVNNAGIWASGDDERRLSPDGYELQFAVNYLSGYLLTRLLLPLLKASAPARIINVASAAQTPIQFDDVMMERGYTGGRGYGQSKLAQILFTFDLAEELEGTGVTVNALHPSTLMDTRMVQEAGVRPRATVDQGADALARLITAPDVGTGRYFNVMEPARANAQAYDAEARARLRQLSDTLTGLADHKSAGDRGTASAPSAHPADVTFMQHMIVHHAQALILARMVPDRTDRRDLNLLARRIERSQDDEIRLMTRWLEANGEAAPVVQLHDPFGHADHAGHTSHTGHTGHPGAHAGHHAGHDHAGMAGMLSDEQLDRLAAARGVEFERLFLEYMIYHHEGALIMVEELFATHGAGQGSEIFQFASHVDSDQRMEIIRMDGLLRALDHH